MFVFPELIPANSGKTTVDKKLFTEFKSYTCYSRRCFSKVATKCKLFLRSNE